MKSEPTKQSTDQTSEDQFICSICQKEVPRSNNYFETNCGHAFCKQHKPDLNSKCPFRESLILEFKSDSQSD